MERLIFKGDNEAVVFDEFTDDTRDYRQFWVTMCSCCKNRFGALLEGRFEDNAAQGVCSVEGCENEAEYYVDFDMDEVEIEYIEEDKMGDSHRIICVNGHYEAHDETTGKFVCSGDTHRECLDTLIEMLAEDIRQELGREEPVAV